MGVRVNSSTKRNGHNSDGMRNARPLPPGLAGGRSTAQTFASSAHAIRNAFRATSRNIIRKLIRLGWRRGHAPARGSGSRPAQWLRCVHLDARRGRRPARHRGRTLRFPGLAVGVLGQPARALRHRLLDPHPQVAALRPALGSHRSRAHQPIVSLTVAGTVRPPTRRRRRPVAPSVDRAICFGGLGPR